MFLAFTSLIILNRLFYETNLKWKILYFLYFLTATSNLFLNGGRTGQLAFAISIFIVGFLNIKNKAVAFFSMLLLVTTIIYTAYNVSPVFEHRIQGSLIEIEKITNGDKYCGSFGKRVALWIVGSEVFIDNPILGTGATCEMDELNEYIDKNHTDMECVKNMPSYHSNYIQPLAQLGIIGFFLYLMIIYHILTLKVQDKQYKNMLIVFVIVYSMSSIFETMLHSQFAEAFFALFVGIFIAKSRLSREV
jgi:O-antigen ligase